MSCRTVPYSYTFDYCLRPRKLSPFSYCMAPTVYEHREPLGRRVAPAKTHSLCRARCRRSPMQPCSRFPATLPKAKPRGPQSAGRRGPRRPPAAAAAHSSFVKGNGGGSIVPNPLYRKGSAPSEPARGDLTGWFVGFSPRATRHVMRGPVFREPRHPNFPRRDMQARIGNRWPPPAAVWRH